MVGYTFYFTPGPSRLSTKESPFVRDVDETNNPIWKLSGLLPFHAHTFVRTIESPSPSSRSKYEKPRRHGCLLFEGFFSEGVKAQYYRQAICWHVAALRAHICSVQVII